MAVAEVEYMKAASSSSRKHVPSDSYIQFSYSAIFKRVMTMLRTLFSCKSWHTGNFDAQSGSARVLMFNLLPQKSTLGWKAWPADMTSENNFTV
jgi:hypothetical protein